MVNEQFVWCPVANVSREPIPSLPAGEFKLGLKHLAPGARVYCFPVRWGDGGERLQVLGRHRGGGPRLIHRIVASKWLTNWRVRKVFQPHVVAAMRGYWADSDEGREMATRMVAARQ